MVKPLLLASLISLTFAFGPSTAEAAPKMTREARTALREQVRGLMNAFRDARAPLQEQVRQASRDYLAGVQTALMLDDAMLELLEEQLDAAMDLAEERFEALDEADQVAATLRAYTLEELKKVTDAATADAAIRAQLDALSVTFVDAILPLKAQIKTLRDDYRAQIRALVKPA